MHTASRDDVRTGTYLVRFNPGVTARTVKVTIKDDKRFEGTEAFKAQLNVHDRYKSKGLKLGNISLATVFINDGMC